MGRKPKLNPDTQERIVSAIAAGNYNSVAAQYGGISEGTFYRWMEQGEKASSGLYHEFHEAVKKAESQAEVRNVAIIERAAQDTWQAAAWWLERKHFARWGRKERIEATGKDGQPLIIRVVYDDHD